MKLQDTANLAVYQELSQILKAAGSGGKDKAGTAAPKCWKLLAD